MKLNYLIIILTCLLISPNFIVANNQFVKDERNTNYFVTTYDGNPQKSGYDSNEGTITRWGNEVTYKWVHFEENGTRYNFEISLVFYRGWYYMQEFYGKRNHDHGNYSRFVTDDPFSNDLYVVARSLKNLARKYNINEADVALSFVQSFPYQENMGRYQRYAVETLIDGRGDCSDTAVLYAGILWALNIDCIFLELPDHLAIGIWSNNRYGSYYNHRDRQFFYCETTNTGWTIGEIPKEFNGIYATFDEVYF